jgi:hypothetical protein
MADELPPPHLLGESLINYGFWNRLPKKELKACIEFHLT